MNINKKYKQFGGIIVNLRNYVEKVIEDACKSEERTNDVLYQYCIIQDTMIFYISTRYRKVARRVLYRLNKNLQKNFGLKFSSDFEFDYINGFNVFTGGYDVNYSFAEWPVFGNFATIRTFPSNPRCKELLNPNYDKEGEEMISKHVEELIKLNPNYYGLSWEEYSELYRKLYNKDLYVISETVTNYTGSNK